MYFSVNLEALFKNYCYRDICRLIKMTLITTVNYISMYIILYVCCNAMFTDKRSRVKLPPVCIHVKAP